MTLRYFVIGLLAAGTMSACYKYPRASPALRCPNWKDVADPVRFAPSKRLVVIDRCSGVYRTVRRPRNVDEDARSYVLDSWLYLSLGRDYEALPAGGAAAARAYLTSISLNGLEQTASTGTGKVELISRLEREKLKRQAFEGLARIAAGRKQPEYAQLMKVCGLLGGVYEQSAEGKADHLELATARAEIAEAERKARNARRRSIAAAVVVAAASAAQAQQGLISETELNSRVQKISDKDNATRKAYQEVLAKARTIRATISTATLEDVTVLDGGRALSGEHALSLLAGSREPASYLKVIANEAAANKWDEVAEIAGHLAASTPTDEDLGSLADALDRLEVSIIKRERLRPAGTP